MEFPPLSSTGVIFIVRLKLERGTRVPLVLLTTPLLLGRMSASGAARGPPAQEVPLKSSAVPRIPSSPGPQSGVAPPRKIPLLHRLEDWLQIVLQVAWPMSRAVKIDSTASAAFCCAM